MMFFLGTYKITGKFDMPIKIQPTQWFVKYYNNFYVYILQ